MMKQFGSLVVRRNARRRRSRRLLAIFTKARRAEHPILADQKVVASRLCDLKGKYVRSPASRPPSRCGPSSGKHPNIRTLRPLAPGLECSDVQLFLRQETRKCVLELRGPVTVPREIGSLSRMNDDRTNIIVSQQCGNLVFGDSGPRPRYSCHRRVWIGEKLLHHLLRCYFPAALGEHRPQSCKQLHSSALGSYGARER